MRAFIRSVLHFIANWFFNSICIYACGSWLTGMHLNPEPGIPLYLLIMELGIVLTLMNSLLRPVLLLLFLPLNGLTAGLFSVLINGFFILLLDRFSDSLLIDSFLTGIGAVAIFAFLNILLQALIPIDDDIIYFNILLQRNASDRKKPLSRGIVMLEIDGLSFPRLQNAIENGRMPFLKDLLNSGDYVLSAYDCGIPSQTSSCQAGIMYGRNENICAFRWYDKENHRVFSSSNPTDAAEMERNLFSGEKPSGILNNGLSINNIISGNAEESILTISHMKSSSREELGKVNRDIYYFSLRPYLLIRSLLLTFLDAGREVLSYLWDLIRRKTPRLNRLQGFYPIIRGATNILLRDISTAMVVDAIAVGREAVYTTFLGYDEIAHHSGPDSHEAYNALGGIDRSIRKICESIRNSGARSYEMVILSDHGQAFGPTFKQRYGESLGEYIRTLAEKCSRSQAELRVVSVEDGEDNNANVMAVLNVFEGEDHGSLVRQTAESLENVISQNEKSRVRAAENEANDILVLASGNLVNAYFQIRDTRLTSDEIEQVYPGLIAEMTAHPGIGTVCVHTKTGPAIFGKNGARHLITGEISGSDPLLMYGDPELRAAQLRYLLDFPSCGDLVIISPVYPDGTVAAYEELIGSHGGLGGQQTMPFLIHSAAVPVQTDIRNSREVYSVLRRIKNMPRPNQTVREEQNSFSLKTLFRQILNVRHWLTVLVRTLFFSPAAYRQTAQDPAFNGPAILIGSILFFSDWIMMNTVFQTGYSIPANFGILALIWGIEILACYMTILIFRGKRDLWSLIRTMLFTGYFGLLWLILLTRQALPVVIPAVLLLRVTTFTLSAISAGNLKGRQSVPVFIILVILIPVLFLAVLMIYNFIIFTSTGGLTHL